MSVFSRGSSWWLQERGLFTLLHKFCLCKASDSRDRVYALLNLSTDTGILQHIEADYSRSPEDVALDTATLLLGLSSRTWWDDLFRYQGWSLDEYLLSLATFESVDEYRIHWIYRAVESNDDILVKAMIETSDVKHDMRNGFGAIMLRKAISLRHEPVIKVLLSLRTDVDFLAEYNLQEGCLMFGQFQYGMSPRRQRIGRGFQIQRDPSTWKPSPVRSTQEFVEWIIQQDGFDVNWRDSIGRTALSWAAENSKHESTVYFLLYQENVDVNIQDHTGRTALFWTVIAADRASFTRLLLERDDIDINARDNESRTALMWAAAVPRNEANLMLLLQHKDVDVNARDNYGLRALLWTDDDEDKEKSLMLMHSMMRVPRRDGTN